MAKGISISVASDTRDFLRGVKSGVLEPLEDVSDALKDVERESDTAGSALEDAMRDGQRKTEDAADEVKDLKDALRDAERNAKDLGRAGKDAGDDTRDGMRRAEDGVEEFRDEANSTAREAAASFDGSAESIGDAFQEIAANAFTGFGPAGAVAGLAAAAGIGLAVAGFEDVQERQERINELAGEWATSYIESGQRVLTAAQEIAALQQVYTESYSDLQDNANEWGVSMETAALAMIGNEEALIASRQSLNERMEESNAISEANTSAYGDVSLAQQGMNQEVINGDSALTELEESFAQAQEQASAYNQQLVTLATTTAGTTVAVNEFGDSVYTLPDGHQVIIDAETGQASEDVENVQFQVNNMQDGNVTVNAATGPVNSQSIANYIATRPSVQLAIRVRTQGGVPIPF